MGGPPADCSFKGSQITLAPNVEPNLTFGIPKGRWVEPHPEPLAIVPVPKAERSAGPQLTFALRGLATRFPRAFGDFLRGRKTEFCGYELTVKLGIPAAFGRVKFAVEAL